ALAYISSVSFLGWDGVGLCSYLLIGFWYKDYRKASAGMKAFVVNRVGDWGFICGLSLLFWGMGGAWLDQGRYLSDYRARFIAVHAEEWSHGEEEGDEPAEHTGGAAKQGDHQGAEQHEDKAEEGPRGKRDINAIARSGNGKGELTFTAYPG